MSGDAAVKRVKAFLSVKVRFVGPLPIFAGVEISSDSGSKCTMLNTFSFDVFEMGAVDYSTAEQDMIAYIMKNEVFAWVRPWVDPSPQQVIGSRFPLHDALHDFAEGTRTVPDVVRVIQEFEAHRVVARAEWDKKLAEETK